MLYPALLSLVVNSSALGLAFLLSLPAISSLLRCLGRRSKTKDQFSTYFYTDRDGEATADAVKAVVRWKRRVAIAVILVVVCGVSLVRAMVNPVREGWMQSGISVCFFFLSPVDSQY